MGGVEVAGGVPTRRHARGQHGGMLSGTVVKPGGRVRVAPPGPSPVGHGVGPGGRTAEIGRGEAVAREDVFDYRDMHRIARVAGAGNGEMGGGQLETGAERGVGLEGLRRRTDVEGPVDVAEGGHHRPLGIDHGHRPGVDLLRQARPFQDRQGGLGHGLQDPVSVPASPRL